MGFVALLAFVLGAVVIGYKYRKVSYPVDMSIGQTLMVGAAGFVGGCLVLVLVMVPIQFLTKEKSPEPQSLPTPIVSNNSWNSGVRQVERYLQANLNDADSYESLEWSKVVESEKGFMVRHKYRARNAFGAKIIQNQVFELDKEGNVVGVSDYR